MQADLFEVIAPLAGRPRGEPLVVAVAVPAEGDPRGRAQRQRSAGPRLRIHLQIVYPSVLPILIEQGSDLIELRLTWRELAGGDFLA